MKTVDKINVVNQLLERLISNLKTQAEMVAYFVAVKTAELVEDANVKRLFPHEQGFIVPTYGVIVHGVSTNFLNIKDQKATTQQMLADNYIVIPSAGISYVGWLTKEATLKQASSIVVEFTDPQMASAIIYAGMI